MPEPDVVRALAEALLVEHLPGAGWEFGFDNAKRRAGLCDYSRRRITVSRYLAAASSDDDVRQTLLHEVAHALVGHAAAHGPAWRAAARRIGYTGERLHHGPIAVDRAAWVGRCSAGHVHYRFRRPAGQLACGICSPRFDRRHLISWRERANGERETGLPESQSTTLTSFQNAT